MDFKTILTKYRNTSFSEKDKGARFERLMQSYLQTDPIYAERFKKVWLWHDFPGRKDLGGIDTGIDLVALTNEGDYWAIQCKCYQESAIIDKPAVNSFLSTSSRQFKGIDLKTRGFSNRLWISTTNHWATEHNKPRYILDLLLSTINVSVQTVDIVNGLPKVDFGKSESEEKGTTINSTEGTYSVAAEKDDK